MSNYEVKIEVKIRELRIVIAWIIICVKNDAKINFLWCRVKEVLVL